MATQTTTQTHTETEQEKDPVPLFRGHPVNIQDRLVETKNFLADEDPKRCLNWTDKFAQLEEFVKLLEEKKDDPLYQHDEAIRKEVRIMVDAHRDRMTRTAAPNHDLVTFDLPPLRPYSVRLMDQETAARLRKERVDSGFTAVREDHPPFTVNRDTDQTEFLRWYIQDANQDPLLMNTAENLFHLEAEAYSRSILNPKSIPYEMARLKEAKKPREEELIIARQEEEKVTNCPNGRFAKAQETRRALRLKFMVMAEMRGIQRASVELALNLFARNEEQKRPQDRFRRLELPAPWVPPVKEVPLSLPLKPEERPLEMDTFAYTKINLDWQRRAQQDYFVGRSIVNRETNTFRHPSIAISANLKGPILDFPDDEISDHEKNQILADRKTELIDVVDQLMQAEERYPRPFLRDVIQAIFDTLDAGCPGAGKKLVQDMAKFGGADYLEFLLALAADPIAPSAPLTHESSVDEWNNYWNATTKPHLAEFSRLIMEFEDEIPIANAQDDNNQAASQFAWADGSITSIGMLVGTVYQKYRHRKHAATPNSSHPRNLSKVDLTETELRDYLKTMADHGFIIYHNDSDTISRSIEYPEVNYVVSDQEAPASGSPQDMIRIPDHFTGLCFKGDVTTTSSFFQRIASYVGAQLRAFRTAEDDGTLEELCRRIRIYQRVRGTQKVEAKIWEDDIYDQVHVLSGRGGEPFREDEDPIPLRQHAIELNAIAPDLYKDLQIHEYKEANNGLEPPHDHEFRTFCSVGTSEKDCARIIQMQLLEEANNNWDLRFPEKEDVWSFASNRISRMLDPTYARPQGDNLERISSQIKIAKDRIAELQQAQTGDTTWDRTCYNDIVRLEARVVDLEDMIGKPKPRKQFFSMLRWPVKCQSEDLQSRIIASGPWIQGKPEIVDDSFKPDDQLQDDFLAPPPQERWHGRGQRPFFPFGETPFQQRFLSWRMEQDLKNVPEFMDRDPDGNLIHEKGYIVDDQMNLINQNGEFVDVDGNLVNEPISADSDDVEPVEVPIVATHICSQSCPVHCAAQDSTQDSTPQKRNPRELPELPKDWKPSYRSMSRQEADIEAAKAIWEDKDLYDKIAPDKPVHDERIFTKTGDQYIMWVQNEKKKAAEEERKKKAEATKLEAERLAPTRTTQGHRSTARRGHQHPSSTQDDDVDGGLISEKAKGKQTADPHGRRDASVFRQPPPLMSGALHKDNTTKTDAQSKGQNSRSPTKRPGKRRVTLESDEDEAEQPAAKRTRSRSPVKSDPKRKTPSEQRNASPAKRQRSGPTVKDGGHVVSEDTEVSGPSRTRAAAQRKKGHGPTVSDGGHLKRDGA